MSCRIVCALRRGADADIDGGIHYRNVNAFLKGKK